MKISKADICQNDDLLDQIENKHKNRFYAGLETDENKFLGSPRALFCFS